MTKFKTLHLRSVHTRFTKSNLSSFLLYFNCKEAVLPRKIFSKDCGFEKSVRFLNYVNAFLKARLTFSIQRSNIIYPDNIHFLLVTLTFISIITFTDLLTSVTLESILGKMLLKK